MSETASPTLESSAEQLTGILINALRDGWDHPELWPQFKSIMMLMPDLPRIAGKRLSHTWAVEERRAIAIICIMCCAAAGDVQTALDNAEALSDDASQSALVQGVVFYLKGLLDPENPKYRLQGRVCVTPFRQLDILEATSHLCCASWLNLSVGDVFAESWEQVWNSPRAQQIRASIHDGSYRFCNKTACPVIQSNLLESAEAPQDRFDDWAEIIARKQTVLSRGPENVNLAYDRTCNLSCPSCRETAYAADEDTRSRYDEMQQTNILPLLRDAKTVFITGSGDPFASKNFRRLMEQLGPDLYPDLRFQVMTNGMLFNRREWARFPALHQRVKLLKISIDAAHGPTHEKLRRGARWGTMLDNMAFAGELLAAGEIENFELVFVVQAENYREMGDAVDLARQVGANRLYFCRLTNWGTFTKETYADKAICNGTHPEHEAFLETMRDPRLLDGAVILGDLRSFLPAAATETAPRH